MSAKRIFEPHLVVRELVLRPACEWRPDWPGWLFVQVISGQAYSVHASKNQEVQAGAVIVFSDSERGYLRASQLDGAALHYFHVEPERLLGLITLREQRNLLEASRRNKAAPRVLPPEHPVAEKFKGACANSDEPGLPARMKLLELFTEMLANDLRARSNDPVSPDPARTRMEELLRQMPMASLVDLRLDHLVQEMGCTPRHVSRLFHEVVGTCFRKKQSEARLLRARELLATTDSKVLDVAMESGFQSVSLFNVMFKREFGSTPGEWRERFKKREMKWRPARRQLLRA